MEIILGLAGSVCLFLGAILALISGIGFLRFPDFYTRMHAVGISDTLVTGLILVGLMLQFPDGMVVIKLVLILLMTLFINPTSSHALAKAAIRSGLKPVVNKPVVNKKDGRES